MSALVRYFPAEFINDVIFGGHFGEIMRENTEYNNTGKSVVVLK